MRINVGRFLTQRARLSPNKVGLCCEGRQWTFLELNRRANRLAHALEQRGVRAGDRVGLLGLNGIAGYDLFFGLGKIGAVLVPINYRLALPELGSILDDSGIHALIYDAEFEDQVAKARQQAPSLVTIRNGAGKSAAEVYEEMLKEAKDSEPVIQAGDDDALAILYTVWATGRPKGVTLTHQNFFWASVTAMTTLTRLGPAFLLALPLFHIGGLAWLPMFMHLGLRCVLMPRFEPDRFLRLLADEEVSAFGAVPTMLHFLKAAPGFARCDFGRLRSILAYGAPVPVNLIEDYGRSGIEIRQLYGLTECAGPAMVIDAEHALEKAGSCGQPFFHTQVKLVDEMGLESLPGEVGEVLIAGAHVMKGYWNQPEATENALLNGWLHTGDLGRQDADGYYYIVDRKKEIIISGGENIFPGEVEKVIGENPRVADVAVLSCPDPVWGEAVMAAVVKKVGEDLSAQEVCDWCQGKIAGYKVPQQVIFLDTLPRTLTGKMEKRKLRKALQDAEKR